VIEVNISAVETNDTMIVGSVELNVPRHQTGPPRVPQVSGEDAVANREEVKRIVEKMQEQLNSMNVSLQYSTYGNRGEKIAVAVVNKETGEVIREIPSKELRNLYAKMSELEGMIFNKMI
jgi:uncharacterized FlaG/YvyC family protein